MCSCERSLQTVVLDNRAASLGIAHCPDISNTQCVTALLSTDVLPRKENTDHCNSNIMTGKE